MSDQEYERIVTEYGDIVYRTALSYAKSADDAQDVLQNTFLKLFLRKKPFSDEEHIRRWLIRVTVNECRNLWASYWRKNVEYKEPEENAPAFSDADHEALYQKLRALPPKCRIVIHLFYYEEYSTREIAELLHIREATVRTRLTRARKLLKQQLEEENDDR